MKTFYKTILMIAVMLLLLTACVLPDSGATAPAAEVVSSAKGVIWPPADQRPFARTSTIRRYRADVGELDLDFVLQIEAISFWKAGAPEEIYHEERQHVMDEVH